MSPGARIAAFVAVLVLVFGGAALAGGAIEPRGANPSAGNDDNMSGETHAEEGATDTAHAPDPVRGLAVAADDLRLVVDEPELRRGRSSDLRFRIVDTRGETLRDFDVTHEKRMHLILARRDLTGFQHLHPTQGADGSWSAPVRLDDAGSYRLFADFSHEDTPQTLATDLRVDGDTDLRPLPAPRPAAKSDGGYDVRVTAEGAHPGQEAELRFTVTRDGAPVKTEPYLGAGGHLVALREGDLAFLHVHPTEQSRNTVGFGATFPTEGRYRLFLQFKHAGRVQTVAFTQEVS
ncbi:MAG TPA: hypothetical protein VEX67_12985 [Solirubrobacteraceae bacterium]|nr:hypothetical protein [Solirubrobacteraceae bacterium]